MDKYSIGEISKETNVTTRTLRYYEEIGLLRPSYVADSGYRYYSKDDVITLQQITTFKKLGFKLSEIKGVLKEAKGISEEERWKNAIQNEIQTIQGEVKRLQDLEKLLYTTFHSIELTGELRTEDLMLFIKSVQGIDQREKFWKRYFNEEEQQIIQGLPTFEENDKRTKEWLQVLREIRERINEPVDSPEVQQLAEKVVAFSMHIFQEDEQLINKYWELIRPEEGEIAKVYGLDSETMKYIDEMVDYYLKKEEDK
ncbi:MerR family transcriptional regulator [Bacillus sp. FSL M8-0063]|uniref:MerR family transcriptional regulator n=1 Tax=Bacillus wiedmannii TaxID=1890302 RepID=A0A1A9PU82_9BACI|nr:MULTISPECIES: MerR family transcriptional regulator [Bacillus]OUB83607.1 transcriptional regulator [Bacillus thuringiensis serovar sinensis]KAA0787312.1 MerR family transcriptional regulator [Bacillus sp. BPN334]MBY7109398.1 MerR family transcriptional regulator [Bacillus sp. 17RED48]MCR6849336.1 MerR family transcriptional regulator [Bacillus sp. IBL03825]MCU5113333.1 MerR family transcriptional regulator [Bacillus wiedmannii]